jgi:4-hydroxythreonine-4-phosphate dehydrogenase
MKLLRPGAARAGRGSVGNHGGEEEEEDDEGAVGNGSHRQRIGITLGDPRGIGPEVVSAALRNQRVAALADYVVVGPAEWETPPGVVLDSVGSWASPGAATSLGHGGLRESDEAVEAAAGALSAAAVERGIELALQGEIDGLVTAPISKRALAAAGYLHSGHTELLQERTGVPDVTMIMAAEETPLGGPLRLALLTVHVQLRDVPDLLTRERIVRRTRIAVEALRGWWGIERPRICFAGLNPHASEEGRFGDEEERVLEPAAAEVAQDRMVSVLGVVPADTAFRRGLDDEVDLVVTPYHDVGLAVIKTLARDSGVNVTAGLPFPRTAPDHGTAFDIAGRGIADPGATIAALKLCVRFCERVRVEAAVSSSMGMR